MTPNHLAKIKRTLQQMRRSPSGIKTMELEGLARALGRHAVSRGKEPTYIRDADPRLTSPLSIPGHATDLRVGTAINIIKALLDDVAVWEAHLRGGNDGSKR
jgi:hypothetical protein